MISTAIPNDDRPSAGSACCVCRTAGHFCPAVVWASDTSEVGICRACKDGVDCSVFAVLRQRNEGFDFDMRPETPPGPVHVIPKEEWPKDTAIHEQRHYIADAPFGLKNVVREEIREKRMQSLKPSPSADRKWLNETFTNCTQVFDELTDEAIGYLKGIADLAPAVSWFVEELVGERWRMVLDDPIFYEDREDARRAAMKLTSEDETKESRTMIWRKEQAPELKRRGRPPGSNYKQPQREKAKAMLLAGTSIRATAASVGLSKNQVIDVKKELPDAPAKANNGGAPQHKEKVMEEVKTPRQLAEESHVKVAEMMIETAHKFQEAGATLPDQLQRALNEPITLTDLEVLRPKHTQGYTTFPDMMIEGLVAKMPPIGSVWKSNDRLRWMDAVIKIVDLLYEDTGTDDWFYSVSRDKL